MQWKDLPLNQRILVNRTLNLNSIKVVGFDMDYTLVIYNEKRTEQVAFQGAAEILVKQKGYPKEVLELEFSPEKIVRGLVVDKRLGNLIKINRFGYVKAAMHGERFLTREEVRQAYSNEIVRFTNPRYEMVHTMFSLASSSLYCHLVGAGGMGRDFEENYEDVTDAINQVHRSGYLKSRIMADPGSYVEPDAAYADTLKMFREFGKKLALVTNSEWEFTRTVMSYCYDRFLGGKGWRSLFDLVVVEASKPEYFHGQHRYFEVIPESGFLRNVSGPIQEGRVYQGGNAAEIETLFAVTGGRVLYIGDHIYSDVLQSKKTSQWRTMLVITELEGELIAAARGASALERIQCAMRDKEAFEFDLAQIAKSKSREKPGPELLAREEKLKERIAEIDGQVSNWITEYDSRFHPHWGELLWAGNDESHFGMAIERYACVYTSKVSNLLNYSPVHYFRPPIKTRF